MSIRLGKTPNNTSDLLKNLKDMFHGQWTDVFEKPFLDSTSKFYAEEAEQVLQHSDISHYLKYVEVHTSQDLKSSLFISFSNLSFLNPENTKLYSSGDCLFQECFRAEEKKCEKHYFFFCRPRLMKVVAKQLLEAHACFLEEGFKLLMDESLMDDLRRMYRLFSRADLVVDYIDRILRSYILAKGERVKQEGSLHELHTSIDKIWHRCFDEDDLLDTTIRDCFEGLGLHVPV